MHCLWSPQHQIDVLLYIYIYSDTVMSLTALESHFTHYISMSEVTLVRGYKNVRL